MSLPGAETGLTADGTLAPPSVPNPVLAEVVRSGFTESVHRGSMIALGPDGAVLAAVGAVSLPMFPRSSNKPMQAAAMLHSGLDLSGHLLALAAASHSGEEFHLGGVREILRAAGLAEADLKCPPDLPLDDSARNALLCGGGQPSPIFMNCSGKHAGMLATCVAAGWPTASYLDPGHPLQLRIRQLVESLTGDPVTAIGVDGCGAPLLALPVAGLARAFREIVLAAPGSAERRVADAMRAHPAWCSGTGRADARLMAAVPGLLLKSGAEGVCAFALADGRAGAIKIDDGAQRPVPLIMAALLIRLLAAAPVPGADTDALVRLATSPLTGGNEVVGEVRPVLAAFGLPG